MYYEKNNKEPITRTRLMQRMGKYLNRERLDESVRYLEELKAIKIVTSQVVGSNGVADHGATLYHFLSTIPFLERAQSRNSYVQQQRQKEEEVRV